MKVIPNLNEYDSLRFGGRGMCWFERANTFKDKRPNTFNDKRYRGAQPAWRLNASSTVMSNERWY